MSIEISASDVRSLADIGFASVFLGLNEEVSPIFDMMTICRPHNAAGYIGKTVQLLYRGKYEEGAALLEEHGLSAEINSDQAKAVHLFALFCAEELDRVRELAEAYLNNEPASTACRNMALLMQESVKAAAAAEASGEDRSPQISTAPRSGAAVPGLPVE